MFVTKFIICNMFSVLLITIIFILRTVLHDKVSLKFQYHIWFVLLFSLATVFVPIPFGIGTMNLNIKVLHNNTNNLPIASPDMVSDDWLYGFTEMTEIVSQVDINKTLLFVWMIGVFLIFGYYYCGNRKLRMIRRYSEPLSKQIIDIFEYCCEKASVKRKIHIAQSDLIISPISFGYRTPYVVLPSYIIKRLSEKEIEHIILHELTHIKNKDIWINSIVCAEQLIYWFNPVIWWAFSKMKCDREAYCDWIVLKGYATNEERLCYGNTLLQFSTAEQAGLNRVTNCLFENKTQLKYRITKIANYKKETGFAKIVENSFIFILALAVMLQVPLFSAFGHDFCLNYTPKHSMKIIEQDYSSLFNNISGCAVIYDSQADIYNVYNKSQITKRIAPCSTFKIYSAINALEQGYITPNNNAIKWDYLCRDFPEWNSDQTLNSAMSNSVNWYFQFLDNVAGTEQLKNFYHRIGYGNGYVCNDTEYYWNGSALKISPLEQVELLVKLHNNEFGFNESNINAVKNAIFLSETEGNKLYGKTGTGRIKGRDVNGWFIGFTETEDNTYFFAFNIQAEQNATGSSAAQIAYTVFETMGIQLK